MPVYVTNGAGWWNRRLLGLRVRIGAAPAAGTAGPGRGCAGRDRGGVMLRTVMNAQVRGHRAHGWPIGQDAHGCTRPSSHGSPICTSTRSTRAPAAATSNWRTWPGGRSARASRCSAPATSPTPAGSTTCASTSSRPSRGSTGCAPDREAEIARRLPPQRARAGPVHALGGDLHDLQARRPDPQGAPPGLPARPRRGRPVQHPARARPGRAGGNLGSDGRPILGLDSRDLLEITLEASPDGFLVPAHIWTPWFSALGSQVRLRRDRRLLRRSGRPHLRGRDRPELRPGDELAGVQPGLATSWCPIRTPTRRRRWPARRRCSPPTWTTSRSATRCETGDGLHGTLEFFPEEGKYHADGHRACGVCWEPAQTRAAGGRCPECGKPLTVGVLHRVEELADRPAGYRPPTGPPATHLIQLHEILGEIARRRRHAARRVDGTARRARRRARLRAGHPAARCRSTTSPGSAASCSARRSAGCAAARCSRTPGYDGEYGVIRLLRPGRAAPAPAADALFDLPAPTAHGPQAAPSPRRAGAAAPAPARRAAAATAGRRPPPAAAASPHQPWEPMLAGMEEVGTGLLDRLDALQRVAASRARRAAAGRRRPGHRQDPHADPPHRLPLRRAERPPGAVPGDHVHPAGRRGDARPGSTVLLGPDADGRHGRDVPRAGPARSCASNAAAAGLAPDFAVADEAQRRRRAAQAGRRRRRVRQGAAASRTWSTSTSCSPLPVGAAARRPGPGRPRTRPAGRGCSSTSTRTSTRRSTSCCGCSCPPDGNLCAIGDPDQAIYSFRGADVGYFLRFAEDFTDARVVRLTRNYRSSAPIIAAAVQAIAPTSLVRGRRLDPARLDPDAPLLGLYPAATAAAEAEWVARDDRRAGRRPLPPVVRLRPGRLPGRGPRRTVLRRHRRALPHRRPGRRRSSRR